MKRLAILILCCTSILSATGLHPYEGRFWRETGGEAIFWLAIVCPLEIGQETRVGNPGDIRVASLRTNPEWGAKLYVGLGNDWARVRLSYLIFNPTQSGRDRNNTAFDAPIAFHIAGTDWSAVQARRRITYQNVEGLFGCYWIRGGRFCGECIWRCRFVDINYNMLVLAKSATERGEYQQKSHFHGIGPGFGGAVQYCVFEGFEIVGEASFMGIIGKRRTPKWQSASSQGPAPNTIITRFDSEYTIIPAFTGRAGVEWLWDFPCFRMLFNISFDWEYYFQPLSYIVDVFSTTDRVCMNMGFAGPTGGLRIHF